MRNKMNLEYDKDPMKNIDGKDGKKMLELLEQQSKKNDLKILRNAKFGEDIATFELEVEFKND